MTEVPAHVLDLAGIRPHRITVLKDVPGGNGNWLVETYGEGPVVLRRYLGALGAQALPVMVVHGDFAEWNVHYLRSRLAGVIDFGLTHLDSRPYELAVA